MAEMTNRIEKLPKVNNPSLTGKATAGTTTTISKPKPEQLSYAEMFQRQSTFKPMTQEEIEKQRKRERSQEILSAIGDGISAFSNIMAASQGAPSRYNGQASLSERNQARWDKLNNEYKTNLQIYNQGLQRAQQLDEQVKQARAEAARKAAADAAEQNRWYSEFIQKQNQQNWERNFKKEELKQKGETEARKADVDLAAIAQRDAASRRDYNYKYSKDNKASTIILSDGSNVRINDDVLDKNIAMLYAMLPEEKQTAKGAPITQSVTDSLGNIRTEIVGYNPASAKDMWAIVSSNMTPEISNTILSLSGESRRISVPQKPPKPPVKDYSNTFGKKEESTFEDAPYKIQEQDAELNAPYLL